ncbi:MAG: protein TolR [Nitrospirae bacterium]|nr:protein TolR [Nitrospirota bacterium]MBI3393774.1 protein TolR [Nitrospirota bacterium]
MPAPRRKGAMAEINVTPLVDVVLVLLIIFMVTAPMMQQGLDVNLPKASAKALPAEEEKMIVTITKKQEVYLNKTKFAVSDLRPKLQAIYADRTRKEIFLKADRDVSYGFVVQVMAEIKKAGIEKLGMVTEPLLEPS